MRFFLSTPVWGQGHLTLFLETGLPSLLAPGNLPALARGHDCTWFLYTRQADRPRLEGAPALARLREAMKIDIALIPEPIENPHRVMSDCHTDTIRRADDASASLVFIPPDCIWSDASMDRMAAIAQSGKSMIHMSGIRLDRDAVVPRLAEHLTPTGELVIGARPLVEIGLQHLHPIAHIHFWKEHAGGLMPANLYWTVPGEGLALRCFHLHPLMVTPQVRHAPFRSTIDDDLALIACPDESLDYVVTDSDEILAFEMSGLDRVVGGEFHKGSIESVACWAEVGTNARHHSLAQNAIRVHHRDATEGTWRPVEREAGEVVAAILRLARLGTLQLALRYPAVVVWRSYAMSLKLGRYTDDSRPMTRMAIQVVHRLIHRNPIVHRMLFDRAGNPRPWHPRRWFLRAATHSTASLSAVAQTPVDPLEAARLQRSADRQVGLRYYRGAERDYSEAIRVSAPNAALHFSRGMMRMRRANMAGATADFEEALRLDPGNPTLTGLLATRPLTNPSVAARFQRQGHIKMRLRLTGSAIADLTRAIEASPPAASLCFLRGKARLRARDWAGAALDFEEGLRLDPENATLKELLETAKAGGKKAGSPAGRAAAPQRAV